MSRLGKWQGVISYAAGAGMVEGTAHNRKLQYRRVMPRHAAVQPSRMPYGAWSHVQLRSIPAKMHGTAGFERKLSAMRELPSFNIISTSVCASSAKLSKAACIFLSSTIQCS